MLVGDLLEPFDERRRRDVEAAFALHRLENEGGDALGFDVVLQDRVDRAQRGVDADAVQLVGERRVEHLAGERAEAELVRRDLAGQPERHHRAAVVAAAERDEARPLGVGAGDLHRVLDRLGAGREKQALLRERARRQRVQPLGQFDIRLVGDDLEAGVGVEVELRLHRGDHVGVAVAGVDDRDAAGEVDVAPAFDVPQLGMAGAGDEDLVRLADAARHGGLAARHQRGVGREGVTVHGRTPLSVQRQL